MRENPMLSRKKTKSRILFTASTVKIVFEKGEQLKALHYEMRARMYLKYVRYVTVHFLVLSLSLFSYNKVVK